MHIKKICEFAAVARSESFSGASRSLGISQQSLSYQIKQIEIEFGSALLVRHSRGVQLTAQGEIFLKHADDIIASLDNAKSSITALEKKQKKQIAIGLAPSPAPLLGVPLIQMSDKEGLNFRLKEGNSNELYQDVARGILDAALCLDEAGGQLRSIPLYNETLYLVGPRNSPLAKLKEISVAELEHFRLVIPRRPHIPRRKLEAAAAQRGVKLMFDQELSTGALRRALLLHASRFTVSAFGAFAEDIENGLLSAARIVGPEITLSTNLICSAKFPRHIEDMIVSLSRTTAIKMPVSGYSI